MIIPWGRSRLKILDMADGYPFSAFRKPGTHPGRLLPAPEGHVLQKIQPAVRTSLFYNGLSGFCKFFIPAAVVIEGWDEFQVLVVCGLHNCKQLIQTVNAFSMGPFVLMNCRPCVPFSVLPWKYRYRCRCFLSVRRSWTYVNTLDKKVERLCCFFSSSSSFCWGVI